MSNKKAIQNFDDMQKDEELEIKINEDKRRQLVTERELKES
jgi:hypothetical protein